MATQLAIAAVSEAIRNLLESHYNPQDFEKNTLQFQVYVAKDFAKEPMQGGVSIFLYRIYTNPVYRTPNGRLLPDGRRQRPQLPVDLHFLITAWAQDASLQHMIAGWMMRVLEDVPSLPASLLNAKYPHVFRDDETVEVGLTDLSTEELFRIWEVIVNNAYQISVPYVARNVRIETAETVPFVGPPIQERNFGLSG